MAKKIRSVGMDEQEPKSGIYILVIDKKISYVGRSADCLARMALHKQNGREFDKGYVLSCSIEDSVWLEKLFIQSIKPAQNKMHHPDATNYVVVPVVNNHLHAPEITPPHPKHWTDVVKLYRSHVTRAEGAQIINKHFFPVSARSLERWPISVRIVNGRAIYETKSLCEEAHKRIDRALVLAVDTKQQKHLY
jgi:hypothetical protein